MTSKHFLAILLGALAIFFWNFVAHMFTPLGESGIAPLPGVESASPALTAAIGDKAGMYMFPTGGLTADSPKQAHSEAMPKIMEEMKTQPSGLLVYFPAGRVFSFPKALAIEFGIELLEAFLVVYLLSRANLAGFGSKVCFVTVAGLLAGISTNLSYWNWYGFNSTYTISQVITEVVGFLFAGIVIALVLKNTPARSPA